MTYNNALLHAAIGYGIRREAWDSDAEFLTLRPDKRLQTVSQANSERSGGLSHEYQSDLTLEDYQATDWIAL